MLIAPGEPVSRTDVAWVRVPSPHLAFARILALFHPGPALERGVSPRAQVHPSARVDPSATVMAFAVVEAGAEVGARTVLWPGVYVGLEAQVGSDCVVHPSVVIRERCRVGNRVVLQPAAVVGSDGFGFAFDPSGPSHVKVPQIGIVRIEDDVEVGAGTCIDRATTGETVIGRGTKIDNLVQIAHNVRVGPLSILCAQVGVSGSTDLGAGVVLAGQVGVVGHVTIGDGEGGCPVGRGPDVEPGRWSPVPRRWSARSGPTTAALKQLPELLKQIRALRARIEALESKKDDRGR